jgi:ornithine carbamoyltransferase
MTGHLLRVGDLSAAEYGEVLELAAAIKGNRTGWLGALRGETLACFLSAPASWRRVLVGALARRLGMEAVMLHAEEVEELRRDPAGDTPRVLSGFAAALVIGTLRQEALRDVAKHATVPVINAGSDEHDPCQALADLLTLREHLGELSGRVIAYVGAADRSVAHSLIAAAALSGMEVRVASPPAHRPVEEIRVEAEAFAELHGGAVVLLEDPQETVAGADAVYTSAWPEELRGSHPRLSPLRPYHVDPPLMRRAKPDAIFMHPLPAHRGEEVSAFVLEGNQSVVWEQSANRLPAAQAAVVHLVRAP